MSQYLSAGNLLDSPLRLFESLRMLLSLKEQSISAELVESSTTLVVKLKYFTRDLTWEFPMDIERPELPLVQIDEEYEILMRQVKNPYTRVIKLEEKDLVDDDCDHSERVKKHVQLCELFGYPPWREHLFRSVEMPNYTLSPDRKTVSQNAGPSGACQAFLAEQPIGATGNTFTVIINSFGTGSNGLLVGVAKSNTSLWGGLHSKVGAYVVLLPNGSEAHPDTFFKNGVKISGKKRTTRQVRAGSRLVVRFDPASNQLSFELDKNALLPELAVTGADRFQLYPVVDLFGAEQSISFE